MTNPAAPPRLFRRRQGSGPQYGSLLLILVVTYLLSALTTASLVSTVQVILFLAVVLIALGSGQFRRRSGQILAVVLLLGSAAAAILRLVDDKGAGAALASLWTALIMFLAVFYIVRQVLRQREITEQSIYGALSAYMMIGLIFAAVYFAMWGFSGHFFTHGTPDGKTFQYFSFTTLTTLGYGDFTAVTDAGRALAVLEAMVGQMFLATLVARLVAGFRWSDRAAARHGQRGEAGAGEPGPDQPGPADYPVPGQSGTHSRAPDQSGGPRPGSAGRPLGKKASADGQIRLNPPGTVRGRGTGLRRGGRNKAGRSRPGPGPRPGDRT